MKDQCRSSTDQNKKVYAEYLGLPPEERIAQLKALDFNKLKEIANKICMDHNNPTLKSLASKNNEQFKRPLISSIQAALNGLKPITHQSNTESKIAHSHSLEVQDIFESFASLPDGFTTARKDALVALLEPIFSDLHKNYSPHGIILIIRIMRDPNKTLDDFRKFLDKLPACGDMDVRPQLWRLKELYDGRVKKFIDADNPQQELQLISTMLDKFFFKTLNRIITRNNVSLKEIKDAHIMLSINLPDILWRQSSGSYTELVNIENRLVKNIIYFNGEYFDLAPDKNDSHRRVKIYYENFFQYLNLYNKYRKMPLHPDDARMQKMCEIEELFDTLTKIERSFPSKSLYSDLICDLKGKVQSMHLEFFEAKAHLREFLEAKTKQHTDRSIVAARFLGVDPNEHIFIIAVGNSLAEEVALEIINDPLIVNKKSKSGELAIGIALANNCADICDILICQPNFQPELPDKDGNNALHLAVKHARFGAVKKLLASGMDLNLLNKNGQTALDIALEREDYISARLLLNKGAEYNKLSSSVRYYVEYQPRALTHVPVNYLIANIQISARALAGSTLNTEAERVFLEMV